MKNSYFPLHSSRKYEKKQIKKSPFQMIFLLYKLDGANEWARTTDLGVMSPVL